jgi:hypothetical protein
MTTRFLLLNPINPMDDMNITVEEFKEALKEFACDCIESVDTEGVTGYYITAPTLKTLANMCTQVELNGNAVEFTNFFDQYVKNI